MGCDMATKTGTREIGPDGWPLDVPSEAEHTSRAMTSRNERSGAPALPMRRRRA